MRRFWLLFAQAVTITLGVYFVLATVRPDLLGRAAGRVQVGTSANPAALLQAAASAPSSGSYRDAAQRAMPAVVNIITSKALRATHPLLKDPFFRKFFGDR